jgi:hypothetical protein
MPMQEYVDGLRSKHARLEQLIDEEMHRPRPDETALFRWKREKLRIKEEIERVRIADKVPPAAVAAEALAH